MFVLMLEVGASHCIFTAAPLESYFLPPRRFRSNEDILQKDILPMRIFLLNSAVFLTSNIFYFELISGTYQTIEKAFHGYFSESR